MLRAFAVGEGEEVAGSAREQAVQFPTNRSPEYSTEPMDDLLIVTVPSSET